MLSLDNIIGAIHHLSYDEKVKLRLLLDDELKPQAATGSNGARARSGLIGLFADEPELIDEIMESVYEHRSRPLRLDN